MADSMDRLQQFNDDHIDDALRRHVDRPRPAGRVTCANLDCGDAIGPQRTALGAQLCLTCQHEEEAREAHFKAWRQPR